MVPIPFLAGAKTSKAIIVQILHTNFPKVYVVVEDKRKKKLECLSQCWYLVILLKKHFQFVQNMLLCNEEKYIVLLFYEQKGFFVCFSKCFFHISSTMNTSLILLIFYNSHQSSRRLSTVNSPAYIKLGYYEADMP